MRRSELKEMHGQLRSLASAAGLRVEFSNMSDDGFPVLFWDGDAKYHTAQIDVDYVWGRGYVRSGHDPEAVFVVSGRYLEERGNASRYARAPWDKRYSRTKDSVKAIEVLTQTVRREDPAERVRRLGMECSDRWCDRPWERARHGLNRIEMALVAEIDDNGVPEFLVGSKDIADDIGSMLKTRDRYVGAWLSQEIIDISVKSELAGLEVRDAVL